MYSISMSELLEFPEFEKEKEEKPKRKATTLYLNSENYMFVRSRLKGKSISVFMDEILNAVAKAMKEDDKKKEQNKKEGEDGKE